MTGRAEQAFNEFVSAWERDEHPDPAAAIAGVPEAERESAAAMITTYLVAQPTRPIPEAAVQARAARAESDPPVAWTELLPALRERAGVTRGALVTALAVDLGHADAATQVEEHVHALETGQLEPSRVRPPVVDALARVLGVSAALLELGRRAAPSVSFAARPIEAFARDAPLVADAPARDADEPERRDRQIDDLFTGGG